MDYTLTFFMAELAAALAIFGYALRRRLKHLMLGRTENRLDNIGKRISGFIVFVMGQKKLFKERFGIVHFVIFWGFIIISLGTIQFIGEGLKEGFALPLIGTNPYFYLVKDIFSLMVLVALYVAAHRRYILRPERLEANLDAGIILGMIAALIITEFLSSGLAYAINPTPGKEMAPVYNFVAIMAEAYGASASTLELQRDIWWWVHITLLFGFLAYLPYSKHMHLMAAPFNVFFRNLKQPGGQINPVNLEDEEAEEFGVGRVEAFTRKQLLDLYACAECGRCQDNCPAHLSGKPLSPKALLHKLKDHLTEKGDALARAGKDDSEQVEEKELIGEVITEDEIWACTTCYSCQEQCPVLNEHINKIIDMRRSLVMDVGEFPSEAKLACRNIEKNFNPWGIGWFSRGDWSQEMSVRMAGVDEPATEYLYWVGCAGSYDDRSRKITHSMVKIMQEAGIDFSIMGSEEKCCGDSARRMGNEYLFQTLATENVEMLKELGVTKIVTHCPHCLNTLKNEYPAFGGNFEVIHHTQMVAELIAQGKLKFRDDLKDLRVAYHDSCYLGRYNNEYEAPRKILASVPGVTLLEAARNKSRSFCCGAGGGRMWMEEHSGQRINGMRVDQLLEKEPEAVSVNCPFCLTMIEDGIKAAGLERPVYAMDVAELVAKSIEYTVVTEEEETAQEMVS
ncbi:MAG: heterodisulfide reductase-related iron-sulfur binding cluster [Bacillota bacterium]